MLTGIILAGGQNRRMGGQHKALLTFNGEPLISRQVRLMKSVCSELIVVTNDPKRFLPVVDRSVRIITDFYPGKGPLSGMHAAFSLAKHKLAWVVGCDMPFVSAAAALQLVEEIERSCIDAAVPCLEGRLHPLHAVYRTSCAASIAELLDAETYRVTELLSRIRCKPIDENAFAERGIEQNFAVNTNTPEEFAEAQQMERKGSLC